MPTARGRIPVSRRHQLKVRKRAHSVKQSRSSKGIFKKVILLLFALGFLYFAWTLYNSWQNSQWISGARITVVVASDSPKIYSYNPQAERLTLLVVPEKTQIAASRGFGSWFAGSLWKLGEQDHLDGALLAESLQKSLGLPIDGWIDEKGEALFVNRKLGFASAFVEAITSSGTASNLTFFDRLQILLRVGGVGFTGRQEIDLVGSGVIQEQKLADGEEGYIVVPEKAKIAFEDIHDDLVFAESKKIRIVNSSAQPGLAAGVTSIVTTLGLRVIGTGTASVEIGDCEVRGEERELKSLSARRLVMVLGCKPSEKESGGPEDLELWLGPKFAERF